MICMKGLLRVEKKSNVWVIILSILVVVLLISNGLTAYLYIDTKNALVYKEKYYAGVDTNFELLQSQNERQKEEIENLNSDLTILNERLSQPIEQPIEQPVEVDVPVANDDSSTTFTVGNSKEHVKKIMGSPDSVMSDSIMDAWWYGKQSWVEFDDNELVSGWYDGGNILKTE